MPPSLSIITPLKNAAPWMKECLHSCLGQNFTDWEWIFVDDHSTDDSWQVLSAFAGSDPRIRIYKTPGRGIIPALQKGLAEATGTFITRMDADDRMPEDRLQKMTEKLKSAPPKSILTGLVKYFSDEPVTEGYRNYEKWLNQVILEKRHWENIYRECVIASPNWMMRRKELLEAGGFNGLEYPEDYDLVFRWYAENFKIIHVPEVTLHWREHPERTSRNSRNYSQTAFFRLKITRFLELDYKPDRNLCLWGTGRKGKLAARLLDKAEIPFTWMGHLPKTEDLYGHRIADYRSLQEINDPQLLVAIYPPGPQRADIENYLQPIGLQNGKEYWYL